MFIMTLSAYSQTIILNENKDTSICFTKNQSKFLLKSYYDLKYCDSLRTISETQFGTCILVSEKKDEMLKEMTMYYENCNAQNRLKDLKIQGLSNDLKKCEKKLKREILYKKVFLFVSIVTTSILTFTILTN